MTVLKQAQLDEDGWGDSRSLTSEGRWLENKSILFHQKSKIKPVLHKKKNIFTDRKSSEVLLPVSNHSTHLFLSSKSLFLYIFQGSVISELVQEGTPTSLNIHRETPQGSSAAGFLPRFWGVDDSGPIRSCAAPINIKEEKPLNVLLQNKGNVDKSKSSKPFINMLAC